MRWNVECADARTGKESVVIIEADTKALAEAEARRRGLLVSNVYKSSVQEPVDALDGLIDVKLEAPDAAIVEAESGAPVHRVTSGAASVPEYTGRKLGASVLRVFALVYYIGGGLMLVVGALSLLARAGAADGATALT